MVSAQSEDQVPAMLSILLKVNFEEWLCKEALLQSHLIARVLHCKGTLLERHFLAPCCEAQIKKLIYTLHEKP